MRKRLLTLAAALIIALLPLGGIGTVQACSGCQAFGTTLAYYAQNPELLGTSTLGQYISENEAQPGLRNEAVENFKAIVCGE